MKNWVIAISSCSLFSVTIFHYHLHNSSFNVQKLVLHNSLYAKLRHVTKMMLQGFLQFRLQSTLYTFYGSYNDLIYRCTVHPFTIFTVALCIMTLSAITNHCQVMFRMVSFIPFWDSLFHSFNDGSGEEHYSSMALIVLFAFAWGSRFPTFDFVYLCFCLFDFDIHVWCRSIWWNAARYVWYLTHWLLPRITWLDQDRCHRSTDDHSW
jgi:hypothetical protein